MASEEAKKLKTKAKASLTLLLVAVISITTATYAWFTLSNSTSVQQMEVRVGTGTRLRVSTSNSTDWADYTTELTTGQVDDALFAAHSYRLTNIRLWPLTSGNGQTLYTQGGNTGTGGGTSATTKYYLELPLWFMADTDMNVYLNADNSPEAVTDDGTSVFSEETDVNKKAVERAARLSFTTYPDGTSNLAENHIIYEPNKNGATTLKGKAKTDNGGNATQPTFVDLGTNTGTGTGGGTGAPVLFSLTANNPKRVVLRLWIEGEDPQCVNGNGVANENKAINLETAKLITRLRFCGADNSGNYLEGAVS